MTLIPCDLGLFRPRALGITQNIRAYSTQLLFSVRLESGMVRVGRSRQHSWPFAFTRFNINNPSLVPPGLIGESFAGMIQSLVGTMFPFHEAAGAQSAPVVVPGSRCGSQAMILSH